MRRRLGLGLVVATGLLLMVAASLIDSFLPDARILGLLLGVVGFVIFGLSGILYTALFVREFFTAN